MNLRRFLTTSGIYGENAHRGGRNSRNRKTARGDMTFFMTSAITVTSGSFCPLDDTHDTIPDLYESFQGL